MAYIKTFEFTHAVRGYHDYKKFWSPQRNHQLQCFNETGNVFDWFTIKVCETKEENTIGHLPRKISSATKLI